jgi:hypothetical protein
VNPGLLIPLAVALAATMSAGAMQRRLRPQVSTFALTAVAVVSAAAVIAGLVGVLLGAVAEVPSLAERIGWCRHFHHRSLVVPVLIGPLACLWLLTIAVQMTRCRRRYTRQVARASGGAALQIIESDRPTAYSIPGRPGRLVVSTGLLEGLRPEERVVVFAHERSHLAHQHGRFVHWTNLAALTFPPLRRLAAQVRFVTERWADEDAAVHVGDRRLVARALTRAALLQAGALPTNSLALTGLGVPARVDALLAAPTSAPRGRLALGLLATSAVVALASSGLQVHHIIELADHLCRVA